VNRRLALFALIALALLLAGCRNETQNRIRRSIQDFTNTRMYITLYSLDGSPVFEGIVDGKVTRSAATLSDSSEGASGSYIFWFDDRGRFHQSNLDYLVTIYDRRAEE
jgi:uncharacterized protein YcfL